MCEVKFNLTYGWMDEYVKKKIVILIKTYKSSF